MEFFRFVDHAERTVQSEIFDIPVHIAEKLEKPSVPGTDIENRTVSFSPNIGYDRVEFSPFEVFSTLGKCLGKMVVLAHTISSEKVFRGFSGFFANSCRL